MHNFYSHQFKADQGAEDDPQKVIDNLRNELSRRDDEIAKLQSALDAAGEQMRQGGVLLQEAADLARGIDEIALEVFQQTLPANAWVRFGEIYFQMNAIEDALRFFECALSVDPANVDALNNIGVLQFKRGDYADAEANLLKALSHNPKRRDVRDNLRMLYATHPIDAFLTSSPV